jgi:hypothetical protein
MIPLELDDPARLQLRASHSRARTKQLLALQSSDADPTISPLSGVLLTDLSEVALLRLATDPLSQFDTPVGFVSGAPFFCEVDLEAGHILFSEKFVEAIEFAAAQASLVNIIGAIKRSSDAHGADVAELKSAMTSAQTALHSLYMSRLTLHILNEAPPPSIAVLLPERHKLFVHHQTALCLTFALLHEQAHLELHRGKESLDSQEISLNEAFVAHDLSDAQKEEFFADSWAIKRVGGPSRGTFLRAASFFFFNQWIIDYLTDVQVSDHPPAFNRIQALMASIPDFKSEDATFFTIMTQGLNRQVQLRAALNTKDQPTRYASLLKWCRSHLAYQDYEALVGSVCRIYEELGLHERPIVG